MAIKSEKKKVPIVDPIIAKLRLDNFKKGYFFLIFGGDELPADQAYHEHPDGRITVEQLTDTLHPFVFIRELSKKACDRLRKKYGLEDIWSPRQSNLKK